MAREWREKSEESEIDPEFPLSHPMMVSKEEAPSTSRRKWLGAQMMRSPERDAGGQLAQIFCLQLESETQALPSSTRTSTRPFAVGKECVEFFFKERDWTLLPSLNMETDWPVLSFSGLFLKEATVICVDASPEFIFFQSESSPRLRRSQTRPSLARVKEGEAGV